MELVFLDRKSFEVVDFAYVDSEYTIIIDNVIPQVSSFTINRTDLAAKNGDFVYVRDPSINYIGILSSCEELEDEYKMVIQTTDLKTLFDYEMVMPNYTGDISVYLMDRINYILHNEEDVKQQYRFIKVAKDYLNIKDTLTFEENKLMSVNTLVETFSKAYQIGITYEMVISNGKLSEITLHITRCNRGLVVNSSLGCISNMVITDTNTQSINKVSFFPNTGNTSYTRPQYYFLLTDGTITQDPYNKLRYPYVCNRSRIYKDSDYPSLKTTAQTEMMASSLEHQITLNLDMDNQTIKPFKDINVGDYIRFITPKKTYDTRITKMVISNSYQVEVTLGEYRVNLTDKIKLLNNRRS